MADERRVEETEEERRARIRRNRMRRERARRRRRRQKIIRLIIAAVLITVIAVVVILTVRKVRRDRAASEASASENLAESQEALDRYEASDVLMLRFPVLMLDQSSAEEESGSAAETSESETDDSSESDASGGGGKYETPLTVSEFNGILRNLYEQGYVLVDIYDVASVSSDGYHAREVSVPQGKKPLIISEEDAGYQEGYDGHADRLVRGTDGSVTCAYTAADGTAREGAVDVVPCVEDFIADHPDFSWQGARGVIGITGQEGVLGYTVTEDSRVIGALSDAAVQAGLSGSGGTEESAGADNSVTAASAEVENAERTNREAVRQNISELKNVLTALRSLGWKFACNSYGGISYASSYDLVREDAGTWEDQVGSILGTTDILLLPDGGDLDGWSGYRDSNEKYQYLKGQGFRYFCVENDAEKTWIQVQAGYVRIGLHTIDSIKAFQSFK